MLNLGQTQAEVIPFKDFKHRIEITKQERKKGRITEYDDKNVYSFSKESKKYKYSGANKDFKNFKCNSCGNQFRVMTIGDIQWVVCSRCGGANIDKLTGKEEQNFENKIS